MDDQVANKNFLLIILVSTFVLFVVSGVFLLVKKGEKKQSARFTQISPTAVQTKGYLKLQTVEGATRFFKNQPVSLQIVADSSGEEIVGFDVLVAYDPAAFDFVKASSLLPDFKVYSYKREGYISLTVIKTLGSRTSSVFKETPVLTVNFMPKKTGQFTLTLKEKIGKEMTSLVNNKTKKIIPRLGPVTVEIY